MFDRNQLQSGTDRSGDETFRKMLFGGSRRNGFRPPVVPAMERVLPQTATERPADTEEARGTPCMEACSLAMVYSPAQEWRELYPINDAIRKGTLFAELDKPFLGKTLLGR